MSRTTANSRAAQLKYRKIVINNIDLIFRRAIDYEQAFDIVQHKLAQSHRTRSYYKLNLASREYVKGYMSSCWAHLSEQLCIERMSGTSDCFTTKARYCYKRFGGRFTTFCDIGIDVIVEI